MGDAAMTPGQDLAFGDMIRRTTDKQPARRGRPAAPARYQHLMRSPMPPARG